MPHEENIVSNVPTPTTWMENLDSVIQSPAGAGSTYFTDEMFAMASSVGKTAEQFHEFFATFDENSNPFINTDDFFNKFQAFLGISTGGAPGALFILWKDTRMLNTFMETLEIGPPTAEITDYLTGNIPVVNGLDVTSGDWKHIYDRAPYTDANGERQIASEILLSFKSSFDHFLANYPYNEDGSVGTTTPISPTNLSLAGFQFFGRWGEFMSRTAKVLEGTNMGVDVPSYEAVYNGLFGVDESAFSAQLQGFYDAFVSNNQPFIPSQEFNNWVTELRDDYMALIGAPEKLKPRDLLIIDRILRLLIDTIGVLQNVSAAQAQRLSFYADWQRAYTDMLTKLPIIGTSYAGASSKQIEGYQTQAATIQTDIRARRDVVGDEAKALQSAVSQSQDAANQQTNMATAIIQQLSTILSQIFR